MTNRSPNHQYILQLVIIALFFCILCFPLTLMAVNGPDNPDANKMSESATELLPLTPVTYFTGSFHSHFEAWFSHHYPMRSAVVSTFKETLYNFEMSKPAIAVMSALSSIGSSYSPQPSVPDEPQPQPPVTDPDTPQEVVDPMAIYFDPDNIYAEINRKQYEDEPVEPQGFKGSSAVYIGKSGYLYESGYIDEYYGYTDFYKNMDHDGIAETIERLEYIQEELEARYDITMLFVLSSSKASQYADFIPEHYKNRFIADPNYVRPVDVMRPLLADSTVNYLDSSAYYKKIGLLNTFPKTGIHWNDVASFETTAELIRMYADISGKDVKILDTVGVISTPTSGPAGNSDQDVFNILYGALGDVPGKIVDDAYYAPDVVVENKDAAPINILIQGGSFTHEILYFLKHYNVGNVRQIYYNGDRNVGAWGKYDPWKKGIMVWEEILYNLDLIIFEETEQQVRGGHVTDGNWENGSKDGNIGSNAVYDSLYEFLKATE